MKKLPEVNISFKDIYDMCTLPIKTKVLLTSIKLGIFNHLSKPISAEAVAGAIGTHPRNTGFFLDCLAAIDLVVKNGGLYYNVPAVQTFLVEESSTYLGNIISYESETKIFTHNDLIKLIKEGPSQPLNPHTSSDEMSEEDVYSYINFEKAGVSQKIVEIVSALPEFTSFRKMLDLGCGPGLNGMAIVAAHSTMKGVSFDRKRTINITKVCINDYGLTRRMEVISGDYTKDSIGGEYDLILASDTLYYTRDEIDPIIKKIYDALNPAGVFLSFHHGLTDERTKPEKMVLGMLYDCLRGEDMGLLDQGFIADAMLRSGFRSVRSSTIETSWGLIDLDIGRK